MSAPSANFARAACSPVSPVKTMVLCGASQLVRGGDRRGVDTGGLEDVRAVEQRAGDGRCRGPQRDAVELAVPHPGLPAAGRDRRQVRVVQHLVAAEERRQVLEELVDALGEVLDRRDVPARHVQPVREVAGGEAGGQHRGVTVAVRRVVGQRRAQSLVHGRVVAVPRRRDRTPQRRDGRVRAALADRAGHRLGRGWPGRTGTPGRWRRRWPRTPRRCRA